jgi:hypothetical protein
MSCYDFNIIFDIFETFFFLQNSKFKNYENEKSRFTQKRFGHSTERKWNSTSRLGSLNMLKLKSLPSQYQEQDLDLDRDSWLVNWDQEIIVEACWDFL